MKNHNGHIGYFYFLPKIIIAIFLSFVLFACRSTRETATTVVTDRSRVSYALPTSNRLTISQLCDSITGLPIPFDSKIATGTANLHAFILNNKLQIELLTDSVQKTKLTEKSSDSNSEKETIVYKIPKWASWTIVVLCCANIMFVVFPGIPKAVRGTIVKLFI